MGTYGSLSHSPVSAALSGALRLILDSGTKHSQTLGCYSSWLHLWAYPKQFKMRSTIFLEYHCMKLTWNILRLLIEIHLFMNIKMIRDHSSVWRSFRIIHIKADLKFFFSLRAVKWQRQQSFSEVCYSLPVLLVFNNTITWRTCQTKMGPNKNSHQVCRTHTLSIHVFIFSNTRQDKSISRPDYNCTSLATKGCEKLIQSWCGHHEHMWRFPQLALKAVSYSTCWYRNVDEDLLLLDFVVAHLQNTRFYSRKVLVPIAQCADRQENKRERFPKQDIYVHLPICSSDLYHIALGIQ